MALADDIRNIGVGLFCLLASRSAKTCIVVEEDKAPHLSIFITAELGAARQQKYFES